jgi:hypothetical protein
MAEQGAEVFVIGSDWDHIKKNKRFAAEDNLVYIPTLPYYKNISLSRIRSHIEFSKDAFQLIKDRECDLLYLVIPPNSQSQIAKKYKEKHPNTKIVMDVIDLWPESFPSLYSEKFPFTLWAAERNKNLKYADVVLSECNLYHEYLAPYCGKEKLKTVYWAHAKETDEEAELIEASIVNAHFSDKFWMLGYLGSVNNIIDIERICDVARILQKTRPVKIQIIGTGERIKEFCDSLCDIGVEVVNYGAIYDLNKKLQILAQCHFGINIMKPTVRVGMSMKAVDYFQMGIPVLNGISGDMEYIVRENACGVNVTELDSNWVYDIQMKKAARLFYKRNCSNEAYRKAILRIIG